MKDKKRKIGLVFGSFNPIHIGHISIATQAINDKICNEVRFVPAKKNPWKEKDVSYDIRLEMVEAAVKDVPFVTYDASETLTTSNYTYDVLEAIRANLKHDEELVILITEETLNDIPNWYKGIEILNDYKFHIVDMPISVHSTDVRNMIKDGKIPLPYIHYDVLKVICREKLYIE